MIPLGGDVDNEEDLPLVGLQAHFLAVAILLRQKKIPNFFCSSRTSDIKF